MKYVDIKMYYNPQCTLELDKENGKYVYKINMSTNNTAYQKRMIYVRNEGNTTAYSTVVNTTKNVIQLQVTNFYTLSPNDVGYIKLTLKGGNNVEEVLTDTITITYDLLP